MKALWMVAAVAACSEPAPVAPDSTTWTERPDAVAGAPLPVAVARTPIDRPPPASYRNKPIDPTTLPLAAFTDVTVAYGISPTKVHGACVAVADFDGDGREDFAVVEVADKTAAIRVVLPRNGGADHVVSPVDTTLLLPTFGCAALDLDSDGHTDLLLGGFAGGAVYLGDGKGAFHDASDTWLPYVNDYTGFTFAPADLDGDGDLDLYVGAGMEPPPCASLHCNWLPTDLYCDIDPPIPHTAQLQDRVLIQGAAPPLQDATAKWQVPPGGTQTVAMPFDVDRDGKMDLLVGDDFGAHRLLHNEGGTFHAFGTDIGFHPYAGAMGWSVSDLDGDGRLEFTLAESGPTPVYEQFATQPGEPLRVVDRGGEWGIWWPTWGSSAWAPLPADFDHDGQDDLLLGIAANFSPEQAADFMNVCDASRKKKDPFEGVPSLDILFTHGPGVEFKAEILPPGTYPHVVMIDQKLIDLDGDGDLDVVQTRPGPTQQPTSRVRVLRNDLPKLGGSATVVVAGKGKNRDALGTLVAARVGGKLKQRFLNGSGSFSWTGTRFAHFGLGKADRLTDVVVNWPDGKTTAVGEVMAGEVKAVAWP